MNAPFDYWLDEKYGETEIAGKPYLTSHVLKTVNPIEYDNHIPVFLKAMQYQIDELAEDILDRLAAYNFAATDDGLDLLKREIVHILDDEEPVIDIDKAARAMMVDWSMARENGYDPRGDM